MEILKRTLESLTVEAPRAHGGLTMFPLVGPRAQAPRAYLTLDEALASGCARVSEISAMGRVPELSFVNDGDRPVLMLDGEELIGAKQNRVLNLTILVPPKRTVIIPVSCVEAGRWSAVSDFFAPSPQVMASAARGRKSAGVTDSMRSTGTRRSDQGAVWSDIAALSARHAVHSDTSRMTEIFEARANDLSGYVRALEPVEGQVGALFAIGRRVLGLELFDHPEVLQRLLPKLVRSWALDALPVASQATQAPGADAARAFLTAITEAETSTHPGVGLGQDVRIAGYGLAGGALVHDDGLLHLCVFDTQEQQGAQSNGGSDERPGGRMISASSRRRRGWGFGR